MNKDQKKINDDNEYNGTDQPVDIPRQPVTRVGEVDVDKDGNTIDHSGEVYNDGTDPETAEKRTPNK